MKIGVISEFDVVKGSGYTTVTEGIAAGLGERGHDVVLLAQMYEGAEHRLPITVLHTAPPALMSHVRLLAKAWVPDVWLGIADITELVAWQPITQLGIPMAGVLPLESDPLIHPSEWTRALDMMSAVFTETEWATKLCREVGIEAVHVPIAIDCKFWRPPTAEERQAARQRLGVAEKWTVLSVSDNHERKNLPALFATVALVTGKDFVWPPANPLRKGEIAARWDDVHLILNTKRRGMLGFELWNLADYFGLQAETTLLQHEKHGGGLTREQLRELYWAADVFVLLSKAEGLGLPIMEAMACGVPCVGTDTGGIAENIGRSRGWLAPIEYSYIDPFGNQTRRYPSAERAAEILVEIRETPAMVKRQTAAALKWVKARTNEKVVDIIEEGLNGIAQEKPEGSPVPY